MRKSFAVLLIFLGTFLLTSQIKKITQNSQKITYEQAETSTDPLFIARFIKENPNHPKDTALRARLISLMGSNGGNSAAKPTIKPIDKEKVEKRLASTSTLAGSPEKRQRTAALLTRLLNNDPNSPNAYVVIRNTSKCNLIIKFSGNQFYNLDVPAKGENFLEVPKGTYTLSTNVCDAKYYAVKSINKDVSIALSQR